MRKILCAALALVLVLGMVVGIPVSVNAASAMTASDELVEVLKQIEGFRAKPYWDHSQWTVGYGTACPSDKLSQYQTYGITQKEAEELLATQLASFVKELNRFANTYGLTWQQHEFDALLSFSYNCGTAWMSETTGYFNNAIRSGATGSDLVYAMCLYSLAGDQYTLTDRRMCEANMYLNGEYKAYNKDTLLYPESYNYVLLDADGGKVRFKICGYDGSEYPQVTATFTQMPTGVDSSGNSFTYRFAGWYTADGQRVDFLDDSYTKGQTLYAKWLDPDGNAKPSSVSTESPMTSVSVTVTASAVNLRSGPGTQYSNVGVATTGKVLTVTQIQSAGGYTWGKTSDGWVALEYTSYGTGLTILTQPVSVTVASGSTAKLSVTAAGTGLSYQWYVCNAGSTTFTKSSIKTATYSVQMNASRAGRKLYCVVTNADGSSVTSKTATIYMGTTLEITKQPVSTCVLGGETATVTVGASGSGLRYQWYICNAGSTEFVKSSITSATYSVQMNSSRTGRQIYCVVTDANGSQVKTNTVTLEMANPVSIARQPVSVTVPAGERAVVNVKATGKNLTYQWYICNAGSTEFVKSSTTTATYKVQMDSSRANRQLYCVVSDAFGNSVSTKTVKLSKGPSLAIIRQPQNVSVTSGKTATVTVEATGMDLGYQWYISDDNGVSFHKSSITSADYSVIMNASRSKRQLYCVIRDGFGNFVKTNTVHMKQVSQEPLAIVTQPKSVVVANGKTATVSVKVTGEGLKYQWYVCNAGSTQFVKSSIISATYSVQMDSSRAGRQIYCVVTDKHGKTVKTDTVMLGMKVSITEQPESVSAANGKTVTVSFAAIGDGLTYKWYFKNKGDSSFTYTPTFSGNTYTTLMNSTRAGRQIYCVVTDKYGNSVKTETVTLGMAVSITEQPVSVSAANGQMVSASVTATGDGLTYKWYFKNAGDTAFSYTATFKGNTYTTQMNSVRAGRQIYCVVTDKYGNSVKTETVTLGMKVSITEQPESVSAANGKTVTVSFAAIGDGLTYRWYFKNKGDSNFTYTPTFSGDTYTTLMNSVRAGRQIYCVVTDKYGNSVKTETVTINMS